MERFLREKLSSELPPRSAIRRSWSQVPLVTTGHVQVVFVVAQTFEGQSDMQESKQ